MASCTPARLLVREMSRTAPDLGGRWLAAGGRRGVGRPSSAAQRTPSRCAENRTRGPTPARAAGGDGGDTSVGLLDRGIMSLFRGGERTREALKQGIAAFYDESSGLWESIWGEHMAQVDMVDRVLSWANISPRAGPGAKALDAGCGIGGSTRRLAAVYGYAATGITLSPVQAARAGALSAAAGVAADFRVADALCTPFGAGEFDLVWSLESGEHMPDKAAFVAECGRVLAPGGTLIIVTWCRRELAPGEAALPESESRLLSALCDAYYLPPWVPISAYVDACGAAGLTGVRTADWSPHVTPFWGAVIASALTPAGALGLLRAGGGTARGALVMPLMAAGLRTGLVKFNLLVATKPLS